MTACLASLLVTWMLRGLAGRDGQAELARVRELAGARPAPPGRDRKQRPRQADGG